MRYFLLLFSLIISCECFAFDIVYPKKNNVTINANSTFFIGSSDKPLSVNGQNVPLHSSGGFAYVVKLNDGLNTFIIQNDDEKKVFVINKPVIKTTYVKQSQFVKFDSRKYFYIINENSPLRKTPVDSGINRISHLQRNVLLICDGEQNGFYRVILGKDFGWIAKTSVKPCENFELASLKNLDFYEDEKYYKYVFHFDKRVPYEISDSMVKFFNINDYPDNELIKVFPNATDKKIVGYGGEYVENDFVWKIRKPLRINPKKPLKGIKIAIDAGHGGNEYGAIGCLGDKEKDINLEISKYLEYELKHRGAQVFLTRNDDSYLGLKERVDIANHKDSVIFLSIHANALPDGADPNKNSGISIYYYYNQAKPLAEVLINEITSKMALNNDKVRQASFAVIRNTEALSLLLETAYMINPEDNSKLIDKDFQKQYAKAIADGLEKYFINY